MGRAGLGELGRLGRKVDRVPRQRRIGVRTTRPRRNEIGPKGIKPAEDHGVKGRIGYDQMFQPGMSRTCPHLRRRPAGACLQASRGSPVNRLPCRKREHPTQHSIARP